MAKIERKKRKFTRGEYIDLYYQKYFNLYMNNIKFEGLDDEQTDFALRKFWSVGSIAAFIPRASIGSDEYPNGMIVLTEFAPSRYNLYDWPIEATLVNNRGVKFIPARPQKINKDVVIGYIQRNKKGVGLIVEYYVRKLADIEMLIQINSNAQKTPWMIFSDPENKARMNEIWNNIDSDDPAFLATINDAKSLNALVSGAPYVVDKLYNYKIAVENELREFLGLGNLGISEKKEHLITAEIEANDDITERYSECILNPLQEFCARVQKYLGYPLSVYVNRPVEPQEEEEEEEEEK